MVLSGKVGKSDFLGVCCGTIEARGMGRGTDRVGVHPASGSPARQRECRIVFFARPCTAVALIVVNAVAFGL